MEFFLQSDDDHCYDVPNIPLQIRTELITMNATFIPISTVKISLSVKFPKDDLLRMSAIWCMYVVFSMILKYIRRILIFDSVTTFVSKREVPRGVRNSKVRRQDKFRRDWSRH